MRDMIEGQYQSGTGSTRRIASSTLTNGSSRKVDSPVTFLNPDFIRFLVLENGQQENLNNFAITECKYMF